MMIEEEISKLKTNHENVNFSTQFCPGSISEETAAAQSRQVSLNEMCMNFQLITMLWTNLGYQTFTNI